MKNVWINNTKNNRSIKYKHFIVRTVKIDLANIAREIISKGMSDYIYDEMHGESISRKVFIIEKI